MDLIVLRFALHSDRDRSCIDARSEQRRLRVELEYVRLVEDYWKNGRSKRRVIASFRRKDLFAPHLERLIEPYCPWRGRLKLSQKNTRARPGNWDG